MSPSKKKTQPRKTQPGLEEALQELEALVEKMEDGELSLEQALAEFQRGIELTRLCRKALKDAEHKVRVLQQQAGIEELAEFPDDDS